MKALTIVIATLFVCPSAVLPAWANHPTEIAIQGPWILYMDKQFVGANGQTVPVLIAIAPTGAIDYKDIGFKEKRNSMRHRPPQLTTGDGYYVTNPKIYCLGFADSSGGALQCAPNPPFSSSDGSVPIKIHSKAQHWDWWAVAQPQGGRDKTVHMALILPTPDSITNDGTWGVEFARAFDETAKGYHFDYVLDAQGNKQWIKKHSTGLILHYHDGPNYFGLLQCNSKPGGPNFGASDCPTPPPPNPKGNSDRKDTHLENSNTLHIQMKAPFNADGCDMHVRMAHRQIADLLGNIASDHAFIEPAFYLNADTPVFDDENRHPCLTEEKRTLKPKPKFETAGANTMAQSESSDTEDSGLVVTERELETLANLLDDLKKKLPSATNEKNAKKKNEREEQNNLLKQSADEVRQISQSYSPDFPRISQIERLTTDLGMWRDVILRSPGSDRLMLNLDPSERAGWRDVLTWLKSQKPATKGPGDCLATTVEIVDP